MTRLTPSRVLADARPSDVIRWPVMRDERERVGLCATCAHVQIVASSKNATFYLCRLSDSDPRFRRYPVLPVISCRGYEQALRE